MENAVEARANALSFFERLDIVRGYKGVSDNTGGNDLPSDVVLPECLGNGALRGLLCEKLDLDDVQFSRLYSPSFLSAAATAAGSQAPKYGKTDADDEDLRVRCYEPESHEGRLVFPLIRSLIQDEISQGVREVLRHANAPVSPDVVAKTYLDALASELGTLCIDAAAFELGLAARERLIHASSIDVLLAEATRIQANDEYIEYFAKKYPVLVDRLAQRARLVARSVAALAGRLHEDRELIADCLGCSPSELLVDSIKRGRGDSHHGADSVAIVHFKTFGPLVYKPRCVTPEAAFQRFLGWLNSLSPDLNLRQSKVYPRCGYGWMEFIPNLPIEDIEQAPRYFHRYGALIAVMQVLNGTDIHHENLIAHGENPVIVDLETILQPILLRSKAGEDKNYLMELEFFVQGPLFTAMIDPAFLHSALNGAPLALTLKRAWEHRRIDWDPTGKLELLQAGEEPSEEHCLRTIDGPVNPYDFRECILEGYERCYRLLLQHKTALLGGLLDDFFSQINIRVIFKATAKYSKIVNVVNSAYAQESFLQQDEYLTKLWLPALTKPILSKIVLAEKRDVLVGDIPYFSADVSSAEVVDSKGTNLGEILAESGIATTRRKIALLSLANLSSDLVVVKQSLERKAQEPLPPTPKTAMGPKIDESSFAFGADPGRILGLLHKRLLVRDGHLVFVDLIMSRDQTIRHAPLGNDFYTGLPGVCLAFAYHAAETGNTESLAKARELAEVVFCTADIESTNQIGTCQGLGGLIYLAGHLSALWSHRGYAEIGLAYTGRLEAICYSDRHFDVFSGAAGAILGLLSLHASTQSGVALEAVFRVGEHLVKHATWENGRCTWLSSIPSNGPTTGFAHGVSGIAYALLQAYRATGNDAFMKCVLGSELFLQDLYIAEQNSWREDAADARDKRWEVWCHGSPGIALFYQALAESTDDASHRAWFDKAYKSNVDNIMFDNDSLCHGMLGNLDPTLNVLASAKFSALHDGARSTAAVLVDTLKRRNLLCGNRYKHYSLSIFNGFAGMAHQLLRVSNPHLPSILRFDPPLVP